jgi:hypothetical protein
VGLWLRDLSGAGVEHLVVELRHADDSHDLSPDWLAPPETSRDSRTGRASCRNPPARRYLRETHETPRRRRLGGDHLAHVGNDLSDLRGGPPPPGPRRYLAAGLPQHVRDLGCEAALAGRRVATQADGNFLEQPAVAVWIGERGIGGIASALRVRSNKAIFRTSMMEHAAGVVEEFADLGSLAE